MALQKTAHDACSRKVHCVGKKYLDDPFVSFFARDSTIVNSPLMNRGTWLRTTAIEKSVQSFAELAKGAPIQIISFGAGVDTLYFRLKKDRKAEVLLSKYVELDFPDLVAEKERVVKSNDIFQEYLGDEYALLPCDLRQPSEVCKLLKEHVKPGVPTILIAEMVFVYIEESITTDLLRHTLSDVLGGPSTSVELITYDAMQPNDRFGQMMLENLSGIGVHLKGILDLPTAADHEKRALDVGFAQVKCRSMKQLYLTVPRDTMMWLNKLEMIDDWDEWNLVHEHYCFLVATTTINPVPVIFDH
ncbi:LOW QUALITY PROTEIN: uncharacterized protein LOC126766804 [Bactrocera neohumeralis]|uniref:LOW QUALITY PROTEIN: uncharacterized protein LOC126766804 n=1 Tax=Bactrocera neohumeralis TaxID=98809 RepID=UPI002166A7A3|nr:LOW QUALITY PROTEIN: uncharacterized protein LOC126766804 [Bactrocera neohumeralis]